MILQQYEFEKLKMIPFQAGFLDNNTYLLADTETKDCVVIDPSSGFEQALKEIRQEGWNLRAFWLTHAHFDHVINAHFAAETNPPIPVAMHPADELIRDSGGIAKPGYAGEPVGCPKPSIDLADGMMLKVGNYDFIVLHTPGHSPGSCCFYCKPAGWLFSGDLVFFESYGRTDLIGSSTDALFRSIREKVLKLPDETVIFPGHDDFTSVGHEKKFY